MNIAIAGFGLEGQSNYAYWAKDPSHTITIVDENEYVEVPDGVKAITGPGAFNQLHGFDLVIRTAGLSPFSIKTDGKIWSATNEFFAHSPAPIVGVTGTKGKGTTASMLASIFKESGKKTWLIGNIGLPSLDVLEQVSPEDIVVYELSSFQLWDVERSPQTAVVLGIEPEHLDVHRDMNDYVNAKGNIRRFQQNGDICVFNTTNDYSVRIAQLTQNGESIPYGLSSEAGGHIKDGFFYVNDTLICSVDELRLKGDHNKENACAAVSAAHAMGVSNDAIAAGLRNFEGLPHRLEFVRTVDGIDYYNDSFSSSTPATIAAVRAFTQPEIVVIGGIDRGGDFHRLAEALKQQVFIKEIILIGDIRHKLEAIFTQYELPVLVSNAQTMGEIVHEATDRARPGDVIILSPGCASFDMFKNFADRGDQFRENVNALGHVNRGAFVFKSYHFDHASSTAHFTYGFESGEQFTEKVTFQTGSQTVDGTVLDRALRLAFLVVGTSYFKTFPTNRVLFEPFSINAAQADFLNKVYQEGLSQFAFENELERNDLAQFATTTDMVEQAAPYNGEGLVALQSGGKDSLLTATLLADTQRIFTPWYVSSSSHVPEVLTSLGQPLVVARRTIDHDGLAGAAAAGAKNGHVPVTYIVQSFALIQAVLLGKNEVLVSIAHEGEEPHAQVGDLPITHQWSKTWGAEQLFAEYVRTHVSADIHIGSPLRAYSELRVAELFVERAWEKYGHSFSSCNRANYKQGANNTELTWCGECPKCANSYVLFAPFLPADELKQLFHGQDLFEKPMLQETFKGLLGVEGVMKPFECVGEVGELQAAYHMAQARGGYGRVQFDVPASTFDYLAEYPAQDWAKLL